MHKLLPIPAEMVDDAADETILNSELQRLERKIVDKQQELRDLEELVAVAKDKLRVLHIALNGFFGDASTTTAPSGTPSGSGAAQSDKWEKLKVKLGGKMAEVIEALLLSSPSTITQIRNQAGGAMSTVKAAVYKLRDMGLLVKNGDGWSLKP